jgi:two-component sensor histidine kinase
LLTLNWHCAVCRQLFSCQFVVLPAEEGIDVHRTVTDNGGGFPDAVPAAGLGTQIVEALVRRLNGRMIVLSTAEGTTVTLLIPLAPAKLRSET